MINKIKKINLNHSFIFFFVVNLFCILLFKFNNLNISSILCLLLILIIGVSHGSLDHIKGKKLLRLFNIKRDDGYIISFSDSTVTKINHKKKRFAVYSFNEFLEESINDSQGGPPQENMDEENDLINSESVEINISDEIEILNNFETRKSEA